MSLLGAAFLQRGFLFVGTPALLKPLRAAHLEARNLAPRGKAIGRFLRSEIWIENSGKRINNQASYRGNQILRQAPDPIADASNMAVELGHAANNPLITA